MRELPIPFNTEMVKAILEGRKTMTRRIVGNDPYRPNYLGCLCDGTHIGRWAGTKRNEGTLWAGFYKESDIFYIDGEKRIDAVYKKCPYGQSGDKLWVRETWKCTKYNNMDGDLGYEVEFKDGTRKYFEFDDNERFHQFGKFAFKNGWQSPYFMPKEAARIWLEVTNVRVERLQEISDTDAWAEGIVDDVPFGTAATKFKELWDSLNSKRGYGWDANPWVWVIEFKRIGGTP